MAVFVEMLFWFIQALKKLSLVRRLVVRKNSLDLLFLMYRPRLINSILHLIEDDVDLIWVDFSFKKKGRETEVTEQD